MSLGTILIIVLLLLLLGALPAWPYKRRLGYYPVGDWDWYSGSDSIVGWKTVRKASAKRPVTRVVADPVSRPVRCAGSIPAAERCVR